MKSLIVTESLEVKNGTVVATYSTLDHSNNSILNFGTAFTANLEHNNQINICLDPNDPDAKTYVINEDAETIEKLNGTIIVIQYLALFAINGTRGPVIKTEFIGQVDKTFKLSESPENVFNLPPVLNFGFSLVKNPKGLIFIPIIPSEDSLDGKTATFPFESDEQEDMVLDNEMTVQYVYMSDYDTDDVIIVVNERIGIEFKEELAYVYLSEKPQNLLNESPILNFCTAQIVAEDGTTIGRCGVDMNYDSDLDKFYFTIEGISHLKNTCIYIQYTTLQERGQLTDKLLNTSFSSEALGLTSEELFDDEQRNTLNFTSEELGITTEMLEEARAKAENPSLNGFNQSILEVVDDVDDDISDAEFTEVNG